MNRGIAAAVAALVIIVGVFAYLNSLDGEERRASQREAVLYLVAEGERVAEVEYADIQKLPEHEFAEVLRSSDAAPREYTYRGVRLRDLLAEHDLPLADAEQVITRAADGYTVALSPDEVMHEDNVYVVYERDGDPLAPKEEGGSGPYQLVIRRDEFGQRWNKFLMEIEVR